VFSAFLGPDDSMGTRTRAVAVPVRATPTGVAIQPSRLLNAHDRVTFENAALL
jgi:hypothetical protein